MKTRLPLYSTLLGSALLTLACTGTGTTEGPGKIRVGSTGSALTSQNGSGQNGSGQNGSGQNGSGQNGSGQNGSGQNGSGQNGSGQNGSGQNGSGQNGSGQNGSGQNGSGQNGDNPNEIAALAYGPTFLANNSIAFASLQGSQLVAKDYLGHAVSGSGLLGARFLGVQVNLIPVVVRIDGVTTSQEPGNSDVYLYSVSSKIGDTWGPTCGVDATGHAIQAVALAGRWDYRGGVAGGGSKINDPNAFTFACVEAPMGKCVIWGYKPWASAQASSYHEACYRMVRADYCGNGRSYTHDGKWIDFYDGIGIQFDTEPTWTFEAEWTASGARCVVPGQLRVLSSPPECAAAIESPSCGAAADFNTGTLLMDKYLPLGGTPP